MAKKGNKDTDRFGRSRAKMADMLRRARGADDLHELVKVYEEFISYTGDRRVAGLPRKPSLHRAGIDTDLYMLASTGVAAEAGELADVMKKTIYHDRASLETMSNKRKADGLAEAGDVMWYFFLWLRSQGLDLEDVLLANMSKLVEDPR